LRIVYVTQRLPFGDGEAFVVPEIEALLAAGHEVMIVPRDATEPIAHDDARGLLPYTQVLGAVPAIAGAVGTTFARTPRDTATVFWQVHRTRPRRRALANARAAAEGLWVARLARAWGADHIHAHWAHLTATLAMSASAASGIPWSFTAHRYDVILNNLLSEKLRSARFGRFIAREMLAIASRFVAPDALARAVVLHMGVELPPAPSHRPVPRAAPVLLCPARLVAVKGHPALLQAAAILAARGIVFELRLAGDGPERSDLERRVRDLGLAARVELMGTVPHGELMRLYREREVDAVVLASLDLGHGLHEGLSVALIEAMAYGLPAIGTRTGGLPELLGDGAGVLVNPEDPTCLADALEAVIRSPEQRATLGTAGRRRVEEQFDVRTIAAQLVRWFDRRLPFAPAA
jgi:glycosyltransferase involved in cell wall biosynthesis